MNTMSQEALFLFGRDVIHPINARIWTNLARDNRGIDVPPGHPWVQEIAWVKRRSRCDQKALWWNYEGTEGQLKNISAE